MIIVSPGGGEDDHPLNASPNSSWSNYFKDNEVLLQIDKDVRRLCPDISFFQKATEFPCEQVFFYYIHLIMLLSDENYKSMRLV